jgi:glucokinase
MRRIYAGIDIGGTGTVIGLFDESRKLLSKTGFATLGARRERFGNPTLFLDRLAEELGKAVAVLETPAELAGAGFGVPGHVDPELGTIRDATNLGWNELSFAAEMERRLSVPVRIDHDVRTFAWAEVRAGAARGCLNALCLTIGTGIAAGIVLDGRLVRGSHSSAGEIGHDSVAGLSTTCPCGKIGCLETVVSAPGIARLAVEAGLGRSDGQPLTATDVSRLCAEGNTHALRIYRYAAGLLAGKLATAVALLDPEAIVIGGGVAEAGEYLFAPIREILHEQFPRLRDKLRVTKGELGDEASLIGALYHIYP